MPETQRIFQVPERRVTRRWIALGGNHAIGWYIGDAVTINAIGTPEEIAQELREIADFVASQKDVQVPDA